MEVSSNTRAYKEESLKESAKQKAQWQDVAVDVRSLGWQAKDSGSELYCSLFTAHGSKGQENQSREEPKEPLKN